MLQTVATRGVYKIVYCSRNCLQDSDEIQRILTKSRENNRRHDVSGALLYNAGCFAQVLEGDQRAVEEIYERIACDPRHSDITMLQAGLRRHARLLPTGRWPIRPSWPRQRSRS